ncbi:hypothetical protein SAY87_019091 [Trapa incisa]|uniref:Protein kinase domain-containing protein n=1 Tax=Trapa incisa TaxID=236973 RepID=A0AAN7Q6Q4_9MYRT|nr:hypothetical protein SAY87_019091 [Trapa incisa]
MHHFLSLSIFAIALVLVAAPCSAASDENSDAAALLKFKSFEAAWPSTFTVNNRDRGQLALDWPTRLKIVKGVAKGLSYLYFALPTLITPHGHLKSSNVLLNDSFEPLLTEYGLVPVINQECSEQLMVAYRSPEYLKNARVTRKTDVWGLGMLILEVLTGKFPASFYLQKGSGVVSDDHPIDHDCQDLAAWVKVGAAAASQAVLDKEMRAPPNSEGEMMKLLKIGIAYCEEDVEKRVEMKAAVEWIDEVKEKVTSQMKTFTRRMRAMPMSRP